MTLPVKRDPSIDLMRFIGLTMIILAHLYLPKDNILFQIRTFDVPLMVFTSGLAFSGKNTGVYLPFIWKRTLRLVVPVYLFCGTYILLNPFLSDIGWVEHYNRWTIWNSLALRLSGSMGYVWIIRVFLIVMLVTPPLVALEKKIRKGWLFYGIIAAMLALQSFLPVWLKDFAMGRFKDGMTASDIIFRNILINDWLLYIVGYSAVFMLGLRFRHAKTNERIGVIAAMAVAMVAMAWTMYPEYGTVFHMNSHKYPPHAYFLVWGAMISCILWATSRYWAPVLDCKLFTFIGRNTIWIYLWHIPMVNIFRFSAISDWSNPIKYVIIYAFAVGIYAIQYHLVRLAEKRWPGNPVTRYLVG